MSLSDAKIRSIKPSDKPFKLTDSQGLYLLVNPGGSRLWYLKYRFNRKESRIALGAYPQVSLSDARQQRDGIRKLLAQNINPAQQRMVEKAAASPEKCFEAVAVAWHKTNKKWSADYAERILASMKNHIFPAIGHVPVTLLKTIRRCIWKASPRRRLKIIILPCRWSEIDFRHKIWAIPATRETIEKVRFSGRGAKMRTPHIVPLSRQAIAILKQINEISGHLELVFPGDHNPYKPMSENTINRALHLMGYDTKTDGCGHGFRAMACSALVESELWSRDAVERQMIHQEHHG